MRQSEIVKSAMYSPETIVTQVLTPAVLSLGNQLQPLPFEEYERTKT